jgi:hypothetical protein
MSSLPEIKAHVNLGNSLIHDLPYRKDDQKLQT